MSVEPPKWNVFRKDALRRWHSRGDNLVLLRIDPPWMDYSYGVMVAFVVLSLGYLVFGRINEYASGPAIVLMQGEKEVTARVNGVVETVAVKPGDQVVAGTELARLSDAAEQAELARLQREIDLVMMQALRSPAQDVRAAMMPLQAAIVAARERVASMVIRAPADGLIRALRIREGQHIGQGEVAVTMSKPGETPLVMLVLPGHARPRLTPETDLRLELKGYPFAFVPLVADSIGAQVMSVKEAKRFLGAEATDAWDLDDSVVLVRARPPAPTFSFNGQTYAFCHGMTGRGDARLHRARVIVALLPALRLLGVDDG